MNIVVALLNPARTHVQSLRRMTDVELSDQLTADPSLVGRLLPVTTPDPRPTGPAVDPQYTIREADVLRQWIIRPSYLRTILPARLAERRYEVETGGVLVGDVAVATDDRSKLMLTGAAVKAAADSEFTTDWKTSGGTWVTVTAAQILALRDAVFAHVNACFAREKELSEQLAEASDTELPALRAAIETFALIP